MGRTKTQYLRVIFAFSISIFLFTKLSAYFCGQKVEIRKIDGVTVVRNPKTPVPVEGIPSKMILTEDLVIGKETNKDDYWFSFVNSVAVDDSENIYTLDPKDIKIRVFNPKGELIRTIGKRGQGPGEFQGPGFIQVVSDGSLIVSDVLQQRFTHFTLQGKLINTIPIAKLGFGVAKMDDRGFIYHLGSKRGETIVSELIQYDKNLNPKVIIHSYERKRSARGVLSTYPASLRFSIRNDGSLVWVMTSTYDIHVVDSKGKLIKRIIRDSDPLKITKADKERYVKNISRGAISRVEFKYQFPEHFPAIERMIIDDQNRIYTRTYERDESGGILHDVFDKKGRYIARFSLPQTEALSVVKNNKLYCIIVENEDGIPLVKRYAVTWKH